MDQPPFIRQPWPKTRRAARHPLEGRMTVNSPEGRVRGWLHDISEEGVGGIVSAELGENTEVEIEFEITSLNAPIRTRAVVRYSNGFRYGFHFVSLTPEQLEAIRQYCASDPKDPG